MISSTNSKSAYMYLYGENHLSQDKKVIKQSQTI